MLKHLLKMARMIRHLLAKAKERWPFIYETIPEADNEK